MLLTMLGDGKPEAGSWKLEAVHHDGRQDELGL
jgi:hypothetical protein